MRRPNSSRALLLITTLAALTLSTAFEPAVVEAQGRRGGRHRVRGVRGFGSFGFAPFGYYGFSPYYRGFGFSPYYYGFGYGARQDGAIDARSLARLMGWGAIDMSIKPGDAEVWVDGSFIAKAKDLDGQPSFLWLEKGTHDVAIYKGGYVTFKETLTIEPGAELELKLKLAKGEAELPPGMMLEADPE